MSLDPFLNQSQDQSGPQMPQLKAGQRLFNKRYELLRPLGAGGMGVVWLACDHTEEIEVALKFLPSVLVLQDSEMKRLREEVRAGKELRHPRLVATYGLEVEDGVAAIVMEYVPGQTLKEKLEAQERGFFEPEEITGWVNDACDALSYLHEEARRIHRDLKPANIIVDAAGHVRLMDFGISHRIQEGVSRHSKTSDSPAGGSSSTLAYASPQQLSGKPSDKADDIYSLGATIYELLTGTPPFFRGGVDAVRGQIKDEPVTPLMERRAELMAEGGNASIGLPVDPRWEQTVHTCLEKERTRRPASAAGVWSALQTSAQPEPAKSAATSASTAKAPVPPPLPVTVVKTAAPAPSPAAVRAPVPSPPPAAVRPQVSPGLLLAAIVVSAMALYVMWSPMLKEWINAPRKPASTQTVRSDDSTQPSAPSAPAAERKPLAGQNSPFVNSLGMKFVPVPMGAGPSSKGQEICFSIWETRSRDYAAYTHNAAYSMSGHVTDEWKTAEMAGVPVGRGTGESAEESSHPVANVSHDDAMAFCLWLTKKDRAAGVIGAKDEYRLPTDVEWSYAVGIGEKENASTTPNDKTRGLTGIYPWGTSFEPSAISGNYSDEDAKANGVELLGLIPGYHDGHATTAPVGSYPPNVLGLYDMGGNLSEWTSSVLEPGSDSFVVRGASWTGYFPENLLSSHREHGTAGFRDYGFGFRCVLVVAGD